jgi:aspartyl-tRNA(Asn)/glutamyl-tRNA(Gln) amidotransferase subunit A
VAIGTQTFGSVIRPAAYCGVIGFKPTYRAISTNGVIPLAWSLDHVGIFSRTVELTAQLAEVLFGQHHYAERLGGISEESTANQRTKIGDIVVGIPDRYFTEGVDATVAEGTLAGLEALRLAGASFAVVRLPSLFEAAIAAAGLILRVEAATFHRKWFFERAADYGIKLRSLIESGNSVSGVEYLKAKQISREAQEQMESVWKQVDFLATPAAPTTAPAGLAWTGDPVFNTPFSIFGNPAVNLPSHYSENGLPAGFQIVGPQWSEPKLLRLALTLERTGFGRVAAIGE